MPRPKIIRGSIWDHELTAIGQLLFLSLRSNQTIGDPILNASNNNSNSNAACNDTDNSAVIAEKR